MGLASIRRRIAFIIFGVFLVWPLFHIFMVKNLEISSWRLFGWGMYATPNPEGQSRLRVVIRQKNKRQATDVGQVHASLTKLSLEQADESTCINLFVEEPELRKLPRNGLCQNDSVVKNLDYFLHFGAPKYLKDFVKEALFSVDQSSLEAYAFLTHQRFNVFQKRAYVESDTYMISGDKVDYLGKIRNEGVVHEGQDY